MVNNVDIAIKRYNKEEKEIIHENDILINAGGSAIVYMFDFEVEENIQTA